MCTSLLVAAFRGLAKRRNNEVFHAKNSPEISY
jgi:hypothetical protein